MRDVTTAGAHRLVWLSVFLVYRECLQYRILYLVSDYTRAHILYFARLSPSSTGLDTDTSDYKYPALPSAESIMTGMID